MEVLNGGLGLGILFFARDLASDVMEGLERRFQSLESTSEEASKKLRTHFSQMKLGLAGMVAGGAALGVISKIGSAAVQAAGNIEMYTVAMRTMLQNQGSNLQADEFIRQLQEFAKETPFDFEGLVESTKQLMAFGFQAERIIPMLTIIGDAVAALGGGVEAQQRIIRAFGQMQAKGRVLAEELMQLQEAGVNAFEILQQELGLTADQIANIGNTGVSASEAIDAILRGLEKRFGGMMAQQARTFEGVRAKIQDARKMLSVQFGEGMMDSVKAVAQDIGSMLDAIEDTGALRAFGKGIGNLVTAFRPVLLVASGVLRVVAEIVRRQPLIGELATTLISVGSAVLFVGGAFMFLRSAIAIAHTMMRIMGLGAFTSLGPLLWITAAISAAVIALRIAFQANFGGIRDLIQSVALVWKGFWSLVSTARMDGKQMVGDMPAEVRDALEEAGLLGWAVGLFKFYARIRTFLEGVVQGIMGFFRIVWTVLQPFVQTMSIVVRVIMSAVTAVAGMFGLLGNVPSTSSWRTFGTVLGAVLGVLVTGAAVKATLALVGLAKAAIAAGISFLMTPWGMAIGAIVAVIGVIYLLIRHWDRLKEAVLSAWDTLRTWATNLPGWAATLLSVFAPIVGIPVLLMRHWDTVVGFFGEIPNRLRAVFDWLTEKFDWLTSGISKVTGFIGRLFGERLEQQLVTAPQHTEPFRSATVPGANVPDVVVPDLSGVMAPFIAQAMNQMQPVPQIVRIPEMAEQGQATVVPASAGMYQGAITWPDTMAQNTAAVMRTYVAEATERPQMELPAQRPTVVVRQPVQLVLDGRTIAEAMVEIEAEDQLRQGRW